MTFDRIYEPCLALGVLAWWGCAPVEAEVGSGLPPASDAGAVDRCDSLAPLRLYYWNTKPEQPSSSIDYILKVENATGAPLPLTSLKVRYYFTNELTPPTSTEIFYADTCCPTKLLDLHADIVTSTQSLPAKPSADAYFEIGFAAAAGSLVSGNAVQVELAFHDPSFARPVTQANDYSYGATATGTQVEWNACPGSRCDAKFTTCSITVYRDDVLVWGTPP